MPEPLWDRGSLSQALGQDVGAIDASSISIDTRTLQAGDIFIALKGKNFDGTQFIEKAFAQGAAGVICENQTGDKIISVASCQQALEQLATYARKRTQALVVGITGSVGKTGVKDMLASVLDAYAAPRSFNNHWGVPLTLARLAPQEKYAVIEMGMNHAGEITQLSKLTRPHLALITQIAPAHIGFFNKVEDIAHAKAEIFDGLEDKGRVLLNQDDAFFPLLQQAAATKTSKELIFTFGEAANSTGRLLAFTPTPEGAEVKAEIGGEVIEFFQYIPARALALNGVAVLTAAHLLGANLSRAAEKLSALTPRVGRGRRELINGIQLIDETYNANPASMSVALESLRNLAGERSLAVLGDMAELGAQSPHYHKALLSEVKKSADQVFLCGEEMKVLYEALPESQRGGYAKTAAALLENIVPKVKKGDKILIKGSQKMKLAALLEQLKERL